MRDELMIGDWVSYKGKMPCKITAICKDTAVVDNDTTQDWRIDYDKLTPILLTAEILLKNGFKQRKQDGDVQYILTADYYDVYVNEYPDGWWLVEYEDSERGDLPTERIAVRNVHQLQDAFRLFGVEKEIEL